MRFFTEQRLLQNMADYMAAYHGDEVAKSGEVLIAEFFLQSLAAQGFPVEEIALRAQRVVINPEEILNYLIEREGVPLYWDLPNASADDEKFILSTLQNSEALIAASSDETFKAYKASSYCRVFFGPVDSKVKAGTSYSSVGLSFFCLSDSVTPAELAPALIHEAVHNALFIEDMIREVFGPQDALEHPRSKVKSAIRGTYRSYDLAFHAAAVGVELVRYHYSAGHPNECKTLLESIRESIDELDRVFVNQAKLGIRCLAENGRRLLRDMRADFDELCVRTS